MNAVPITFISEMVREGLKLVKLLYDKKNLAYDIKTLMRFTFIRKVDCLIRRIASKQIIRASLKT